MSDPLRLTEPDAARDAGFIERVRTALGLPPDAPRRPGVQGRMGALTPLAAGVGGPWWPDGSPPGTGPADSTGER